MEDEDEGEETTIIKPSRRGDGRVKRSDGNNCSGSPTRDCRPSSLFQLPGTTAIATDQTSYSINEWGSLNAHQNRNLSWDQKV